MVNERLLASGQSGGTEPRQQPVEWYQSLQPVDQCGAALQQERRQEHGGYGYREEGLVGAL